MKQVLQILVAAAALLLVGALSQVPFTPEKPDNALLRLSWRVRGEAVEQCRDRTPEELEKLPIHMRTPQVCTGRVSAYRLEIELDEKEYPVTELRAAGARADRPIYVFREFPIVAGEHEIEVEFYSTHSPEKRVKFERRVHAEPGEILLLTYDQQRNSLYLSRSAR